VQAFHAASSMTETPSYVPIHEAFMPEKVQQMVLSALSALGI